MGKLFGTDGIRGEANRYPMNAETAFKVGQTVAYLFKRNSHRARIVIGKDTRLSGYMLESSLEAGITSMGGDPYLVGVLPTPGIAFITQSMRADAGIVISASHNPYQDNGLKIFNADGFKLTDEQEHKIEAMILGDKLNELLPEAKDMGKASRIHDIHGRYIDFLKNTFPRNLSMEGMKIVMDTSNGATYRIAPEVFGELGADFDVIHNTPNGLNINDHCGSQHTRDLRNAVIKKGAAIGLAFDGDGDRLIAVDEKGNELTGDQLLIICAYILKKEGRLKNDFVVSTVMSNLGLRVACKKYGFKHHASSIGDRYVLADMLRLDAIIGGEDAGHMIFLEHHKTGDGIIAAMQVIAAMLKESKPLSELALLMSVFPQKLINIDVKSKPDIDKIPKIVEAIRQAEKELGEEGRVLVRYSGTQNMCRVMVEGPSHAITEKYCRQIADVVKSEIG
ncbi:MAG: phosphoglucosamine mutase [Smithella sp.]|nr:phosphoglucosamine mutase [Smithella sp.]HOU52228.1 phosphoglucosamine mutase [Smithella sp.]HQG66855.1 phosphoglucosamine mutase [Smithella sp.]